MKQEDTVSVIIDGGSKKFIQTITFDYEAGTRIIADPIVDLTVKTEFSKVQNLKRRKILTKSDA